MDDSPDYSIAPEPLIMRCRRCWKEAPRSEAGWLIVALGERKYALDYPVSTLELAAAADWQFLHYCPYCAQDIKKHAFPWMFSRPDIK